MMQQSCQFDVEAGSMLKLVFTAAVVVQRVQHFTCGPRSDFLWWCLHSLQVELIPEWQKVLAVFQGIKR
jgi:hypothetical protein